MGTKSEIKQTPKKGRFPKSANYGDEIFKSF
jgi:hypothetical protein